MLFWRVSESTGLSANSLRSMPKTKIFDGLGNGLVEKQSEHPTLVHLMLWRLSNTALSRFAGSTTQRTTLNHQERLESNASWQYLCSLPHFASIYKLRASCLAPRFGSNGRPTILASPFYCFGFEAERPAGYCKAAMHVLWRAGAGRWHSASFRWHCSDSLPFADW